MRISKLHLIVCAATLFGGIVIVRADDNPAQAAARAALEEKMQELNAEPASTNVQTPPPVRHEKAAQPATITAPATPPPAAAPETPVAVTPSGATLQEPANPPVAPATTPSASPPIKKPVKAAAPAESVETAQHASNASNSDQGLFAPVPPPSGSMPATAEPEQTTQPPTAVQTQPPSQNPKVSYTGKSFGFEPIVAPPLPVSPMQQAELQALLDKYNANAITPEQYQAERAKILAEHQ